MTETTTLRSLTAEEASRHSTAGLQELDFEWGQVHRELVFEVSDRQWTDDQSSPGFRALVDREQAVLGQLRIISNELAARNGVDTTGLEIVDI